MNPYQLFEEFGFRRTFLMMAAVVQVGYGTGLLASHFQAGMPKWWPAIVPTLSGLATWWWGFVWLGIAVTVMGLTLFTRSTRWQFALVVTLNAFWALSALLFAIEHPQPGWWAVPSIYGGIAFAFVIMSGWPEPRDGLE